MFLKIWKINFENCAIIPSIMCIIPSIVHYSINQLCIIPSIMTTVVQIQDPVIYGCQNCQSLCIAFQVNALKMTFSEKCANLLNLKGKKSLEFLTISAKLLLNAVPIELFFTNRFSSNRTGPNPSYFLDPINKKIFTQRLIISAYTKPTFNVS